MAHCQVKKEMNWSGAKPQSGLIVAGACLCRPASGFVEIKTQERTMKNKVIHGILFVALMVCFSAGAATQVIEGSTGTRAKYLIAMPDDWNGDLVVYAHGFIDAALPIALPVNDDIEALRDMLTDSGYAVAYSSYSKNGFAVREGARDTLKLNSVFIRRFGRPVHTYLVGHSLGGAVCVKLAETFPHLYDGVLSVAGMIGGSKAEIDYMANVRVLWELFYPGVLPGGINDVPEDVDLLNDIVVPIVSAITVDPTGAGAIALIDQTPVPWDFIDGAQLVQSYATALGFWYRGYNDVAERTGTDATRHGNLYYQSHHGRHAGSKVFYDNSETVYTSSYLPTNTIAGINAYVERFEGSNQAAHYFWRYYEPKGKLNIPMLSLHNNRDPAVPVFHEALYAHKVAEQGKSDLLVQRIIDRYGHTETFSAAEVYDAFEELVDWVDTGVSLTP